MRIPRYQNQTAVSLGGYSRPITESGPALQPLARRDERAYMVDQRAGQRNMQLEAQAAASGALVADAVGKTVPKLMMAFADADGSAEITAAKQALDAYNLGQLHKVKNTPFEMDAVDSKNPYGREPTYPHITANYLTNVNQQVSDLAGTISLPKFRKEFLTYAKNEVQSYYTQVEAYQHKMHLEYLKGKVHEQLFSAKDKQEQDVILTSDAAMLALDPTERFELRFEYGKKIENDYWNEQLATYRDDPVALDQIISRLTLGGVTGTDGKIVALPDDEQYLQYLESDDVQALVGQVVKLQDRSEKLLNRETEKAVAAEAVNIIGTPGYTLDDLNAFQDRYPNMSASEYRALVAMVVESSQGPLIEDPEAYAIALDELDDLTTSDIASHPSLTLPQKGRLLEKKVTALEGAASWERSNFGRRALGRLQRLYKVALTDTGFSAYMPGTSKEKKDELIAAYNDAYTELEAHLYNMGDTQTNFTDAELPGAAWDWVLAHEAKYKADAAATNKAAELQSKWKLNVDNRFEGRSVDVEAINEMSYVDQQYWVERWRNHFGNIEGIVLKESVEESDDPDGTFMDVLRGFFGGTQ